MFKSILFLGAFMAFFSVTNPVAAATLPVSLDQDMLPPEVPYDRPIKVYVWENPDNATASCKVGTLSLTAPAEDQPDTLSGRLMVFSKKKTTGLGSNHRYTVPQDVKFSENTALTCDDPLPDSVADLGVDPCDCILAFFPTAQGFDQFAEIPRAPVETTPYVAPGAQPFQRLRAVSVLSTPSGNRPTGGDNAPITPRDSADEDPGKDDVSKEDEGVNGDAGDQSTDSATRKRETLDFNHPAIKSGLNDSLILDFALVTTEVGSKIYVYEPDDHGMPSTGGLCGFDTGFWCTADLYFDFFDQIANLEFQTFFFDGHDSIVAQVFAGDILLSEKEISRNGLVGFDGISGITRLVLLNDSPQVEGSAGAAFGNFSFNLADIPLPMTSSQLLAGLGLIFIISRRRQRYHQGN